MFWLALKCLPASLCVSIVGPPKHCCMGRPSSLRAVESSWQTQADAPRPLKVVSTASFSLALRLSSVCEEAKPWALAIENRAASAARPSVLLATEPLRQWAERKLCLPKLLFFGCSVSVTSEVASRQNTLNVYICKQLTSMRFEIEGLYFFCHYSLSSGWRVIWRAPNRDFHLRLHPYTKSSGTTGGGRRESRRTVTRQLCLLAVIGKMCRWNHNIWLPKWATHTQELRLTSKDGWGTCISFTLRWGLLMTAERGRVSLLQGQASW